MTSGATGSWEAFDTANRTAPGSTVSITGGTGGLISTGSGYLLSRSGAQINEAGGIASNITSPTLTVTQTGSVASSDWVMAGALFQPQGGGVTTLGGLPSITALTLNQGAALDLGGQNQTVFSPSDSAPGLGGIVQNSGGAPSTLTLAPTGGNASTFSGVIGGGGGGAIALTLSGSGLQVLAGNNTYTGATTIGSGGTLQIGAGGGTGSLTGASSITNNGVLVFDNSGTLAQGTNFSSAAIQGTGSVVVSTGLVNYSATNNYSGNTTVNGGTLELSTGGNPGALKSGTTVIVNSGATLLGNFTDPLDYNGNTVNLTINSGGLMYMNSGFRRVAHDDQHDGRDVQRLSGAKGRRQRRLLHERPMDRDLRRRWQPGDCQRCRDRPQRRHPRRQSRHRQPAG